MSLCIANWAGGRRSRQPPSRPSFGNPVLPRYFRLTPWVVTGTDPNRVCIAEAHRVSLRGEVNAVHELYMQRTSNDPRSGLSTSFMPDFEMCPSMHACSEVHDRYVLPCPLQLMLYLYMCVPAGELRIQSLYFYQVHYSGNSYRYCDWCYPSMQRQPGLQPMYNERCC